MARSGAATVEGSDKAITDIFSRMSTRDVAKMSTILKRWRKLIFDPVFAPSHYTNSPKESIYVVHEQPELQQQMRHKFHFVCHNPQTGNLSTVTFSLRCMPIPVFREISFFNTSSSLVAASHGLLCFSYYLPIAEITGFVVYNPVTKFFRNLPPPPTAPELRMPYPWLVAICSPHNSGKLVMVGNCPHLGEDTITLVFDSVSNSWYESPPPAEYYMHSSSDTGYPLYLNGVIYFIVRTPHREDQEEDEPRDGEPLFADEEGLHYKVIGYNVNQDLWCFAIFLPISVGYPYCLIEFEGNLLVVAANSTHEENLLVLAASSTLVCNRQIRYINNEGDGRFVFWTLDIRQKLWAREWDLDLSAEIHDSWLVAASGGVVWFATGHNSVIVYHMKHRLWTNHPLDGESYLTPYFERNDAPIPLKLKDKVYVAFEPTFLSF